MSVTCQTRNQVKEATIKSNEQIAKQINKAQEMTDLQKGINLSILECKFSLDWSENFVDPCINLSILECKYINVNVSIAEIKLSHRYGNRLIGDSLETTDNLNDVENLNN